MTPNILSYPENAVPANLKTQVHDLQYSAWGGIRPATPQLVHDPALKPFSMLLVHEAMVLAALDILSKPIIHHGEQYDASGLSAVVTHPAERGKGYGHQLVTAARATMAAWNIDIGLFTCDPPWQHFYERCGWQLLVNAPLIGGTPDQPFPSDQLGKITFAAFFSAKAQQHAQDFQNSPIALYPGNVDKLW